MTLILLVSGLTLVASFLCSLFEAALYAVTPTQVEMLKTRGSDRIWKLRQDIEEPIAAILTVNTIAHTVGSAWCGALVAAEFSQNDGDGGQAVAIFAAIFTFLVLALTEIIPKSIGVRYAMALAPKIAWPVQWMIWLVWPIARPSRAIMRFLTSHGEASGPSEDEVVVLAGMAAQQGGLRSEEHQWISNAVRLDKLRAGDLRTPRTVVEMHPAEMTVGEAVQRTADWVHSRVPIYENGDRDSVVGVVFRREVFDAGVRGDLDRTLREFTHELRRVPESMPAHKLLEMYLQERRHMVAVVDEYGGFDGILTLEDVLERMLGTDIVDEHDQHVDLQKVARRRGRKPEL